MEDWTKKEIPKTTLNVWEENILLQELKEHENFHNAIKGQITIGLDRFVKDIRKQICEEIRKWCKENFDYNKLSNELGCWVAVNREEFFAVLDKIQRGE